MKDYHKVLQHVEQTLLQPFLEYDFMLYVTPIRTGLDGDGGSRFLVARIQMCLHLVWRRVSKILSPILPKLATTIEDLHVSLTASQMHTSTSFDMPSLVQ